MSLLFNMLSRLVIAFLPRSKCLLMQSYFSNQHLAYMKADPNFGLNLHYFANKVRLVKAMVFPVVMYGCESWNIKKAEH